MLQSIRQRPQFRKKLHKILFDTFLMERKAYEILFWWKKSHEILFWQKKTIEFFFISEMFLLWANQVVRAVYPTDEASTRQTQGWKLFLHSAKNKILCWINFYRLQKCKNAHTIYFIIGCFARLSLFKPWGWHLKSHHENDIS